MILFRLSVEFLNNLQAMQIPDQMKAMPTFMYIELLVSFNYYAFF